MFRIMVFPYRKRVFSCLEQQEVTGDWISFDHGWPPAQTTVIQNDQQCVNVGSSVRVMCVCKGNLRIRPTVCIALSLSEHSWSCSFSEYEFVYTIRAYVCVWSMSLCTKGIRSAAPTPVTQAPDCSSRTLPP